MALGVGAAEARGAGSAFSISSAGLGDFLGETEGVGERFGCFFFVEGDSVGLRDFRAFTLGLFFGLGVADSSSSARFAFLVSGVSLGEGFAVAFFLCLAVLGFAAGLGDSSGDVDGAARAFKNSARFSFSSSVSCAWTSVPMIPLSASKTASQRRKRNTTASVTERPVRSTRENSRRQAACAAMAGVDVVASPSRSRRRIAFNLPPRRRSRQVRYIQVSNKMMDASAR